MIKILSCTNTIWYVLEQETSLALLFTCRSLETDLRVNWTIYGFSGQLGWIVQFAWSESESGSRSVNSQQYCAVNLVHLICNVKNTGDLSDFELSLLILYVCLLVTSAVCLNILALILCFNSRSQMIVGLLFQWSFWPHDPGWPCCGQCVSQKHNFFFSNEVAFEITLFMIW